VERGPALCQRRDKSSITRGVQLRRSSPIHAFGGARGQRLCVKTDTKQKEGGKKEAGLGRPDKAK